MITKSKLERYDWIIEYKIPLPGVYAFHPSNILINQIIVYAYCLSSENNYLELYLTKIDFLAKEYFTDSTILYPFPIPFPCRQGKGLG